MKNAEIAVIGAGAAGLMAAIAAAREAPGARVCAIDGATRLGAKILIAGGGRCNVTHRAVEADDFSGSTQPAIRRILRGFDVEATRAFFLAEGVALKEEATGKLFPVSDRARDVLEALLAAARRAGVVLQHPWRVTAITPTGEGFLVHGDDAGDPLGATSVILATGGRSVPKTGSDGSGYALASRLGLPLTPRVFPALVPLRLPDGHLICRLSGLSVEARLLVVSATGRHLHVVRGSVLCTHQGLSGPAVLDISRHWQAATEAEAEAGLLLDWLPGVAPEALDGRLRALGVRAVRRALVPPLPERLAEAVCALADVDPDQTGATLTREGRRRLVTAATGWRVPVTGTRGFEVAEVTAGGVPLAALTADLEARVRPGVFVCGELCDVDGRIGGFNFQWAWASGTAAGRAAARRVVRARTPVSG